MRPSATSPAPDSPAHAPTLGQIFTAFAKIGLTSFGGGLSGWMLREFVQARRWLSEAEFLSGLALAQAFPGVNVVNLSIWIGFRLRGGRGAFMAALGMIVPPMTTAIILAALFAELSHSPTVHVVLAGIAAAAVGLSLQMGLRAAYRAATGPLPILVMVVVFGTIFIAGLPLLWVVGLMAPVSILLAYLRLRRGGGQP
ncbi:chromate transporter [Bordetella genomosp. 11]|uniref:Chromate transporter n=1 Tax=Bordetella genomosp. 11 TaxID=1416808 RepID=A0A261UXN1_9BORD|nr:chromate transporter [Bordetella genomosp. 11]OZI66327.1 chromate transporter [Bordetella genomosp. 11]